MSNSLQIRIQAQEEVISKLAVNPSSFATQLYSIKTQPNRRAFGPDLAKSSFQAFSDSGLCTLVLENKTPQEGQTILEDDINQNANTNTSNSFLVRDENTVLQVKSYSIPDPDDLSIRVDWSQQAPNEATTSTHRFIASDTFTHTTLLNFMVRFYLNQIAPGLNTIQNVYSASICSIPTPGILGPRTQRFGSQLTDFCDLGTLDKIGTQVSTSLKSNRVHQSFLEKRTISMLSPETNGLDRIKFDNKVVGRVDKTFQVLVVKPQIIIRICKQVLTTLLILQTHMAFQHGKLLCSAIGLSSQRLRTKYGCVQFDDPFTCKLMGFDSAACSVNLNGTIYRMYQRSPVWGPWISQVLPKTDVQLIKMVQVKKGLGRRVESLSETINVNQFEKYLKSELNVPEKQISTFDTYTFMLSFLSIPEVFYSVFTNPKLRIALWDPLFLVGQEAGNTERGIKDGIDFKVGGRGGLGFESVFRLMQGKSLSSLATFTILNNLINLEEEFRF